MEQPRITESGTDLGRQLTADVAGLALSLPIIARDVFAVVVLPFVYAASLILVVLFLTPFHAMPFVASAGTHSLDTVRSLGLLIAGLVFILSLVTPIAPLSFRWYLMLLVALIALMTLTIDLRRSFA